LAIYRDIKDINFEKRVVTVGTFDGVHSGHRLLLKRVVNLATQNRLKSVALTFWPHPHYVLSEKTEKPKMLNTLDEKTSLLIQNGVDEVIVIPFDEKFSRMSASDFIKKIIKEKLNSSYLVVGEDHHFGNSRTGNVQHLSEFAAKNDLLVDVVDLKKMDGKISSSEIRKALQSGNLKLANEMLGYEYMISGTVKDGRRIGRTIGFPTANIETPDYKLLPKEGVYRVKVSTFDKIGMLYIGKRPVLKQENETVHVEVHIFDFEQEIYGEEITLLLTHYIRDNTQFENVEQLAEQLKKDKKYIVGL